MWISLLFIASAALAVELPLELQGQFYKTHAIDRHSQRVIAIPANVRWTKIINTDSGELAVINDNGDFCEVAFTFEVRKVPRSRSDYFLDIRNEILKPGSHPACHLIPELQSRTSYTRRVRITEEGHFDLADKSISLDGGIWATQTR